MAVQLPFQRPPRPTNRPPMPLPPFIPDAAQSFPTLLDAYPCPAFIVRVQSTLRPVWANRAFGAAFSVPNVPLKDSFVHVLASTEDGQRYAMWSMDTSTEPRSRPGKKRYREDEGEADSTDFTTTQLSVRVRLVIGEGELRLVKTRLDDLLIITSTLDFHLISPTDVSPVPNKRIRDDPFPATFSPLPRLKLNTCNSLLTPEGTPVISTQSPLSAPSGSASVVAWPSKAHHTLGAVVPAPCPTATKALFDSFSWDKTPLGSQSTWSERLCTAVNIMQTSPHPVSTITRRSSIT